MSTFSGPFLAHSENRSGKVDTLCSHLEDVANRAADYAEAFDARDEAWLAGMLHDLGKYGELFQRRLEGKECGIDHWSAGAWEALTKFKYKGIASALAIQGHHIGLQGVDSLRDIDPAKIKRTRPLGLRLSEPDANELLARFGNDGLSVTDPADGSDSLYERANGPAASMLDLRMLYSVLVDADFIETEAHFECNPDGSKQYREAGLLLEPESALSVLLSYLNDLARGSASSPEVNRMRADLLNACLDAASREQGLFTLTAPTGAGKTLSMMAFALKHAETRGLRRIVTVIPYLSIIEQTVREYSMALKKHTKADIERYILEHHSLVGARSGQDIDIASDKDMEDESCRRKRLLAENWDTPIVVTTSVQFLESLFANRPAACRKLHRLAKSVILFDEVQTLPKHLIVPTLATLSRLCERYGSTVVFATATQPAFVRLDEATREYCRHGWRPSEITPPGLNLFARARRTEVQWPDLDRQISWSTLADQLTEHDEVLCIVNLKRHALQLYDELKERNVEGLFHLSTNMCPAHRSSKLEEVRARLRDRRPCSLVSTQCVEAGVDIDFPVVFRAWAPLDAVAQAAGRCNRNGSVHKATVHVFIPEDEAYPDGAYKQAAAVTRMLLRKHGLGRMDIHDPSLFREYYSELYDFARPERQKPELLAAVKRQDFVEVAQRYRVIEKNAINVLVPYDLDVFHQLTQEVRETRLTKKWIGRARPHTIGLFEPKQGDRVRDWLEQVPLGRKKFSQEWFVYLKEDHYHPDKGLVTPTSMECLIG